MPNPVHSQAQMQRQRQRIGFVLMPGFSLMGAANAIEVLHIANLVLGARWFDVELLSIDGNAVQSASGPTMQVHAALDQASALDSVFVVAETMPAGKDERLLELGQRIDAAAKQRTHAQVAAGGSPHAQVAAGSAHAQAQVASVLGGIGTGAAWWAFAGLMNGYKCTLPNTHVVELTTSCTEVLVTATLYEVDRNRLSCLAHASLDLLIHWLTSSVFAQHGSERFLQALLAHFSLDRIREPKLRIAPATVHPTASSKFAEAVALMQSNLSEPLSTEDIANLVGVSRRQLERLFKQHLDTLPSRWYLEQRLIMARRLLLESSQSILQVGLSCGFTSAAHFSNAYRNHFERTPRDERSARAAAWRQAPIKAVGNAVPEATLVSNTATDDLPHQSNSIPEKDSHD